MVRFDFDKNIKIGSYITAYTKGFHIVTNLTRGGSSGTIVHYKRVLNTNGAPAKSKNEMSCDGSYCKLIDKKFVDTLVSKEQTAFETLRDNLLKLV